jgi:hypothetical protein
MLMPEVSNICNVKGLKNILRSLDSDEGVRIGQSGERTKMFISKGSSGVFAVQIVSDDSINDHDVSVEYLNLAQEVVSVIKTVFKEEVSYLVY